MLETCFLSSSNCLTPAGVTALELSVPALASVVVASSTIPLVEVEEFGSSPVFVPLVFSIYVVEIAVPCQTPVDIVPSVVIFVLPVKACKLAGVTALAVGVPAFASAFVANSTIPLTLVVASGSSPVFVPELVPVMSLNKATVPLSFLRVTVLSPPVSVAVVKFNSVSALEPEAPSNCNVLFSTTFTVSLAVVVSP